MQTTTLSAPDIECEGCAIAIKKALAKIAGISCVDVDVEEKQVTVSHDDDVSRAALTVVLDRAGFLVAR